MSQPKRRRFLVPLLCVATAASAQTPEPAAERAPDPDCEPVAHLRVLDMVDPSADFARLAEIVGRLPSRPRVVRRVSDERRLPVCGDVARLPWHFGLDRGAEGGAAVVEALPVRAAWNLNTGYADDRNNGALWEGRGVSGELVTGLRLRAGPLTASVEPRLIYQENRAFELVPVETEGFSSYSHGFYGGKIDFPQRFGADDFWTLDPGQTSIRLDVGPIVAGASSENLWWGPAMRYPPLMSNTAPGFLHAFTGTSRPVDIGIGRFEARMMWGRLDESDYYDTNPENDDRLFVGMVFDYEPKWVPGLYLGMARAFQYGSEQDLGLNQIVPLFEGFLSERLLRPDNPHSGDEGKNEFFSFFFRWVMPEAGFEFWGEFARDDAAFDFEDLVEEPEHARGVNVGFQKVLEAGRRTWVRVGGEIINLQSREPQRIARPFAIFYVHTPVEQGHTHRGQILGAGIGPGSDAQFLNVDLFAPWGSVGLFGERVRRDEMSEAAIAARQIWPFEHDVEMTIGSRVTGLLGDFRIGAGVSYSFRYNRRFLEDDTNWTLQLSVARLLDAHRLSP